MWGKELFFHSAKGRALHGVPAKTAGTPKKHDKEVVKNSVIKASQSFIFGSTLWTKSELFEENTE